MTCENHAERGVGSCGPVYLICPDPSQAISGGHIYNQRLLDAARTSAYPMHWCDLETGRRLASRLPDGIWLWDSLYLPSLAATGFRAAGGRHAALLHGLIDLDFTSGALRSLLSSFRWVIVTGAGVGERLAVLLPGVEVVVIEPGISEAFRWRAPRRPDGVIRLVTVANLLPAKRPLELLEALAPLAGDWIWDWVGADSEESGLASTFLEKIRALGLEGRVRFRGPMTPRQLGRWLPSRDLMIFASREETYGMALAEALAIGLPVLSTRVGEAARLIHQGHNGWVVDNEVGALCEVLATLLIETDQLAALRARREPQARRDWWVVFFEFLELFSAIEGKQKHRPGGPGR